MKKIAIALLFGASWLGAGQEATPTIPDSAVKDYMRALAAHWQQTAALQASMTAQQKQLEESIQKIDGEIAGIRKKLAAACGEKAALDESGPEPICKQKPEEKKPEPSPSK